MKTTEGSDDMVAETVPVPRYPLRQWAEAAAQADKRDRMDRERNALLTGLFRLLRVAALDAGGPLVRGGAEALDALWEQFGAVEVEGDKPAVVIDGLRFEAFSFGRDEPTTFLVGPDTSRPGRRTALVETLAELGEQWDYLTADEGDRARLLAAVPTRPGAVPAEWGAAGAFASQLTAHAEERGWDLQRLAAELGYSTNHTYAVMSGRVKPGRPMMRAAVERLGLAVAGLEDEADDE